jgi:ketosteroid isomerase-like protein
MTPLETVLEFLNRINQRDAGRLAELMTQDHLFTDSLGRTVSGRETMCAGWQGYYAMCPDYWVSHECILAEGPVVAAFGAAGGTIAGVAWRIAAAWRAVVEGGLVKEWQVYADNKPVYDILSRKEAATA